MHEKIISLSEITEILKKDREVGHKIVHCHGVFDLLHPGHVRHLQEARNQGGRLVVSLTPDRFVNKGPGRPVFSENLRLEQVASLACVDYVVLNDSPDAVSIIKKVQPDLYVKGMEYSQSKADVTGKIVDEKEAVESVGGNLYFTNDITFSSSSLLNRFFDSDAEKLKPFLDSLKKVFSLEEILQKIEELSALKVLVVGDAIIDEYQYVQPLGLSGKGFHIAARCLDSETFLGGSLIVANHVSAFVGEVTLLSALGASCPHHGFIRDKLHPRVKSEFVTIENLPTLTKRRYVLRDGKTLTKLFETYSSNDLLLNENQTAQACQFLQKQAQNFDAVVVCDFGNGYTNPYLVDALSKTPTFLAVNTQVNSGNRGFHVVTHYQRADFISLNEPEIRLAAHDRYSSLESIVATMADRLNCQTISVTRGVNGVLLYDRNEGFFQIPALTMHSIDRLGAGDSYLSLASLCAAKKYPPLLVAFLGSVAAAIDVQIVGNRDSVQKAGLCKYVTRLFK